MGKFDGLLLASDYDGTLRGTTQQVLETDKAAIRYFQDEGGIFLVATGRSYNSFVALAEELPLRSPTLLSNGAVLQQMDTGEVLWQHDLPSSAVADIPYLSAMFPQIAAELYHNEQVCCLNPNEESERWQRIQPELQYTIGTASDFPTPWLKVLFRGAFEPLRSLREYVLSHWEDRYACIFSYPTLLELTGRNVHKGAAVAQYAQAHEIAKERIFCVGDNDNDLPLLRAAQVAFAPEGSPAARWDLPHLKIVRDADHGCVANVVEWLETHIC